MPRNQVSYMGETQATHRTVRSREPAVGTGLKVELLGVDARQVVLNKKRKFS